MVLSHPNKYLICSLQIHNLYITLHVDMTSVSCRSCPLLGVSVLGDSTVMSKLFNPDYCWIVWPNTIGWFVIIWFWCLFSNRFNRLNQLNFVLFSHEILIFFHEMFYFRRWNFRILKFHSGNQKCLRNFWFPLWNFDFSQEIFDNCYEIFYFVIHVIYLPPTINMKVAISLQKLLEHGLTF